MILFIDTSKPETKIALYNNQQLLVEKVWISVKNQSEELLYEIDKIIKNVRKSKTDLERIVVAKGPGSYTGLRVGLSTANALAMCLDVEIDYIKSGSSEQIQGKKLVCKKRYFKEAVMPTYLHQPKITEPKHRR